MLVQNNEKWGLEMGCSLVPDALERSIAIQNTHMSALPGHPVMFHGNICLDF